MPFGSKNPLKYKHSTFRTIHPESYDVCPVCNQAIEVKDGYVPVAACVVPPTNVFDTEQVVVLACQSCYYSHRRLAFQSLDDFKEHRKSPRQRGRPVGTYKKLDEFVEQDGEVKTKARAKASMRLTDCANPLTELVKSIDEFEKSLIKAAKAKCDELRAMLLESMPLKVDEATTNDALGSNDDELSDDDLDFGMTDEQRARFDALKNRSGSVLPTMAPPEVDTSEW